MTLSASQVEISQPPPPVASFEEPHDAEQRALQLETRDLGIYELNLESCPVSGIYFGVPL